jgi:hypothetical protein
MSCEIVIIRTFRVTVVFDTYVGVVGQFSVLQGLCLVRKKNSSQW